MRRLWVWIGRFFAFITGIGILAALIYFAGFEDFFDVLVNTSPFWVFVSVTVYSISWVFRVLRLKRFTEYFGRKIRLFDLFRLHVSGYALNIILPAKLGDLATILYLKMRGIGFGGSAAIVFQTRILDLMALFLFSISTLTLFFQHGTPEWMLAGMLVCVFFFSTPFIVVFLDRSKSLSNLLEGLEKRFSFGILKRVVGKTKDAYVGYHEILSCRSLFLVSILLSVSIWLFEGIVCYFVSVAVGFHISPIVAIFAVSIANVIKAVPVVPGGIGIYESSLAAVLTLSNTPFEVAVAIAILDHTIKNLFTLVFGIPATTNIGINVYKTLLNF